MSVVDSVFSGVGGRAIWSLQKMATITDIFYHFFLRFQYNHLQIFLFTAASVKLSEKWYEIP